MPPVSPDAPHAAPAARRRWKAPRTVRREISLATLHPDVWDAATGAIERAFGRPGTTRETSDGLLWTAEPSWGRSQVALWSDTTWGGARLVAEHVRPETRPYVLTSALLCVPIGVLAALVLGPRSATPDEWAVVAGLLAVPLLVAVWVGAFAWTRTLVAARRLRRVMAQTALAARVAGSSRPAAPSPSAAVWDDGPEASTFRDAFPRRAPRVRQAHAVAQATAERRRAAPVVPSAAEWL